MNNFEMDDFQKYHVPYENSYMRSYRSQKEPYNVQIKKKHVDWRKVTALILGTSMIATAFASRIKDNYDHTTAHAYIKQHMNTSFKHYDPIDNNTYYDMSKCARDILNYVGSKKPDVLIYSYYLVFDIDVERQMDALFTELQKQIDNSTDNEHIMAMKHNYYYASFQEYIKAKGYSTIDEYKKAMDQKVLAYKEMMESKEVAEEILEMDDSWEMRQ